MNFFKEKLEIKGFRRPSYVFSKNSYVYILCEGFENKIYIINNGKVVLSKVLNKIGLKSANSIIVDRRNHIIMLDSTKGNILVFNHNFDPLNKINLKGKYFSDLFYCKIKDEVFVCIDKVLKKLTT